MLGALTGFLVVTVLSSFVEYWGHRLMHTGRVLRAKHAEHHRIGWGQGWIWEFRDYALPSLPFAWLGFLWSVPAGIGFAFGAVFYAALAAYAHQLQHERPNALFWLEQPVHAVHHYHQEWHHNFGIVTDVWDRLFGTYRAHPHIQSFDALDDGSGFLAIHWTTPATPLPTVTHPGRSA